MSSSQPTPGLCYVTSIPKDAAQLSDADFNKFYNDEHVPDILSYGFSKLALRYKNADPDSKAAYLALYPQDDVDNINSPATAKMMEECRYAKVLGGKDHHALIQYGVSAWSKIHTFEPYSQRGKSGEGRAKTLVAVMIEPAGGDGAGGEEDLDAWYRKQHLDMLSMCRGYVRSTRYRRDAAPRFLALHEYPCSAAELPAEQIQRVRETEWSRSVRGAVKVMEREVWELVGEWGERGVGWLLR